MQPVSLPSLVHITPKMKEVNLSRTESSSVRVDVEEGSSAVLLDDIRGSDATHEIAMSVSDGASLTYISFIRPGDTAKVHLRLQGTVGRGASISWILATVGGKEITADLQCALEGEGARSDVHWVSYARSEEKYMLTAQNSFLAPHGAGEIIMRSVAEEKAHISCKGKIDIGLKGGGTDTYLTQEVLMLDKTAKVDAVPGLEIKTNDVKASHSATVSRVTEEDLFYFASRGIPERDARRMFVIGFLQDIAEKIPSEDLRKTLFQSIEDKYGG